MHDQYDAECFGMPKWRDLTVWMHCDRSNKGAGHGGLCCVHLKGHFAPLWVLERMLYRRSCIRKGILRHLVYRTGASWLGYILLRRGCLRGRHRLLPGGRGGFRTDEQDDGVHHVGHEHELQHNVGRQLAGADGALAVQVDRRSNGP